MAKHRYTFLAALLMVAPAPASAFDLLRAFAACTGRYSAQMEHQWLMHQPGADQSQMRRAQFADMVDAVRAPDQGPEVLSWRIEAKVAQAALFHTSTFGQTANLRETATLRARAEIDACDMLLLRG